MEKRKFKDKNLSLLGFGCMRFPMKGGKIDFDKTQEMMDLGYRKGVNYFDTAPIYHDGESETVIGEILSSYKRDSLYIADKLSAWTVENLDGAKRLFEKQLKKLKTDYIDFYLCHSMNEDYFKSYEKHKYIDYLHSLKQQGLIKHLGFSYHGAVDFLPTMLTAYPFEFAQLQVNYFDWEYQDAKTQYAILEKAGIPCVVMEPVRGGMLASLSEDANKILKSRSDKSIASWAVRYVASLKNVITVLSGMSSREQVEDNLSTVQNFQPLTKEEETALQAALEKHKKAVSVPCTGCNYCNLCPQKIDIPKVFSGYNKYKLTKEEDSFMLEQAKKCVHCMKCQKHCPQSILISERMREIKELR